MRSARNELRALRQKKGFTLDFASRTVGVSKGQLSKLERYPSSKLDIGLAIRLSDLYGIKLDAWREREPGAASESGL